MKTVLKHTAMGMLFALGMTAVFFAIWPAVSALILSALKVGGVMWPDGDKFFMMKALLMVVAFVVAIIVGIFAGVGLWIAGIGVVLVGLFVGPDQMENGIEWLSTLMKGEIDSKMLKSLLSLKYGAVIMPYTVALGLLIGLGSGLSKWGIARLERRSASRARAALDRPTMATASTGSDYAHHHVDVIDDIVGDDGGDFDCD